MSAFVSRFFAGAVGAVFCCLAMAPAQAFGPQTHAWLAQRLLADISRDCRLEIAGRRYGLDKQSCSALRDHPAYFIAGATTTANLPDPVTARLTMRQGVSNGWSSGEWLQQLLQQADTPQAMAFALGNVFQAGQEVFANSYVNAFAGAPFSLQADDDVLLRHMAIERYLDAHLPAVTAVAVTPGLPLDFLRSFYLENPQVLAQYQQLPETAHLRAMRELPTALQAATQDMESLQIMAQEMLAYYSSMPFSPEALHEEFGSRAAVVADAGATAAAKEARWLNAKAAQTRQQDVLKQLDDKLQQIEAAAGQQLKKISDQEKKLLQLPSIVRQQDCHNVRKWINSKEWTNNRVCQKTATANPERKKARTVLDAERSKLAGQEAQRQQMQLQKQLMVAELAGADEELQAASLARQEKGADPDSLTALLMRRADALQALRLSLTVLDDFFALSRQWQDEMVRAERDYLRIALPQNAVSATSGKAALPDVQAYRRWLGCSGRVFLAQPSDMTPACDDLLPAQQMQSMLARLEEALRSEALRPLREQYAETRRNKGAALQRQLTATAQSLHDFVAPASALARLSRLQATAAAGRVALQEMLASSGSGQQPLLTVRNAADLIDADAGIKSARVLNAEAFNALQYAERFSRMALLPGRELNRLAGRTAGWYFGRWALHPETDEARYSLLFSALRSMDGNQQWQPYGLPYARAAGAAQPQQAEQRHFGYGPADGEGAGLAIFIDAEARRKVFLNLFPRRLSLLETHPRLQAPNYPFPSCAAHPFPVTFTHAGNASMADSSCSPREMAQQ